MSTRVTNVHIKDGKITRVHKLSASKRIGAKAKADRATKAWKAKSK